MRQSLIVLLGAAALVTGCATKNYVHQAVQPIQTKVDQVADQTNKQGAEFDQTRKDIDKNTTAINATDEKATAADRRAGDALNKANQIDQKTDQNSREINSVRQSLANTVANLDNYKVVGQTTVLFGFNQAMLTKESKQQLDQLATSSAGFKRYFIAVEGFTDQTGSADYNLELSKRRAEAVVQYLAVQRDIDFNRIHTIGFGEEKLADTGRTREARAKNRRVGVKLYSVDEALASQTSSR